MSNPEGKVSARVAPTDSDGVGALESFGISVPGCIPEIQDRPGGNGYTANVDIDDRAAQQTLNR